MKTINKDMKVYIAEDGTEFLNESDCLVYENTTLEIVKNVKYFLPWTLSTKHLLSPEIIMTAISVLST